MRFGQNVLRMIWKEGFVQFSWKAHCFPFLRRISGQCDWRFWELWRSQMRFGQYVLRKTWKERFVQFLWKAHCFLVLKRIWYKFNDFQKFDPQKCDLGKTCCAWSEKSALYNFHKKRTVFPFWREFQASVTIFRTFTLKNATWAKRVAHDLKRAFCTIFMKSALFSLFKENFRRVWRFSELWPSKMRFAKTCCAWPKKNVLYKFYGKRTVFPFWKEFQASVTIFRTLTLKNATWAKRVAHDLKRAFCTIFMKSALFSLFEENFRRVWRFSEPWPSKMRFAKTCCAWPKKNVLYKFYGTVLRMTCAKEFQAVLKRAFYNFYGALFFLFVLTPVWRFWELWCSKMRYGQNVLPMTWKERFLQFSWQAHCFSVLRTISGQCDDFDNFELQKCDLAKPCSAWREKSVLYNFQGKRTVFPF